MTSINPWNFESIEDFHFYCCPECDTKTKESQDFMNHAVQHHAKSIPIRTLKNFILNLKVIDSDPLSVVPSIKKINLKVKKPVVKLQRLTESKILYHTSPKKVAKEENNKLIYNDVEDNLDQEDKELKTENDLSIDFDSVEQGMDEDQRDENMFLCLMLKKSVQAKKHWSNIWKVTIPMKVKKSLIMEILMTPKMRTWKKKLMLVTTKYPWKKIVMKTSNFLIVHL